MEILRLVWMECGWKSVCENTSRNCGGRVALACADGHRRDWHQMDGQTPWDVWFVSGLEACAVIRPQHRWLISTGLVP